MTWNPLKALRATLDRALIRAELTRTAMALGAPRRLAEDIALGLNLRNRRDLEVVTRWLADHASPELWAEIANTKEPR